MREDNYWRRHSLSRRSVLRGAVAGSAGIAGAVLIGCGSDDEESTTSAAPAAAPAAPAATAAPAVAAAPAKPPQGGTLRARIHGDPPNWSVMKPSSATTHAVSELIYDKLLKVKTGPGVGRTEVQAVPSLAEDMPEVSPDGLEYIFKIPSGVKFQNVAPVSGRDLTSEDVATCIMHFATTGNFKRDFARVQSAEAVDGNTIKVTLSSPYAPLINLSAGHYGWRIFPPEILENDLHKSEAIGSGPWIRESYEQGNKAVYVRNPDYWAGDEGAYLEKIEHVIIPDDSAAGAAFGAGEVDLLIGRLPCVQAQELAKQVGDTATVQIAPGNSAWFGLNTSGKPFDDIRVRQAVALGYDRQADSDAIFCGTGTVTGLIPMDEALFPEDAASFPEAASWLRYDVAEAKKLLAAAGYADGVKTTAVFTPRYGQVYQFGLERAIGDLKKIGMEVEPIAYEYGEWIQGIYRSPYAFDGILWGPGRNYPDADPYVGYWLHPDGIANHSRVNDPIITDLIEKQRTQTDPAERWETLHEVQRVEAKNMYYVWRTAGDTTNFIADWVGDYNHHAGYDAGEYAHVYDKRLA